MKRFTETTRWIDPWFRKLPPLAKLLWCYLCDNCDGAGIIELDIDAAAFSVGDKLDESQISAIGDRIDRKDGKILIRKFVQFQYGELTPECNAHKPVIAIIAKYGLVRDDKGYRFPTPKEREGLAKGTDRVVKWQHQNAIEALKILNQLSGRDFRETETNLKLISARLSEKGVTLDGVRMMIERQCKRWLGTDQAEYLRPETLFGKAKFDGYYAAREQPVVSPVKKHDPADRNANNMNRAIIGQYDNIGKVI